MKGTIETLEVYWLWSAHTKMLIRSVADVCRSVSFCPAIEPVMSSIMATSRLWPPLPPTANWAWAIGCCPLEISGSLAILASCRNGVLMKAVPLAVRDIPSELTAKLMLSLMTGKAAGGILRIDVLRSRDRARIVRAIGLQPAPAREKSGVDGSDRLIPRMQPTAEVYRGANGQHQNDSHQVQIRWQRCRSGPDKRSYMVVLPAWNTEAVLRRHDNTASSHLSLKVRQSAKRGFGVRRVKLKTELKS